MKLDIGSLVIGAGYPLVLDDEYNKVLVSGGFGSGVCATINTIIFNLAKTYTADELQMYMVDATGCEFSIFGSDNEHIKLPHIKILGTTDIKKSLDDIICMIDSVTDDDGVERVIIINEYLKVQEMFTKEFHYILIHAEKVGVRMIMITQGQHLYSWLVEESAHICHKCNYMYSMENLGSDCASKLIPRNGYAYTKWPKQDKQLWRVTPTLRESYQSPRVPGLDDLFKSQDFMKSFVIT